MRDSGGYLATHQFPTIAVMVVKTVLNQSDRIVLLRVSQLQKYLTAAAAARNARNNIADTLTRWCESFGWYGLVTPRTRTTRYVTTFSNRKFEFGERLAVH
jgi:hypothetical protein